MTNNRTRILVGGGLLACAAVLLVFSNIGSHRPAATPSPENELHSAGETSPNPSVSAVHAEKPQLHYESSTVDKVAVLLNSDPDDTPAAKSAMKFLRSWMDDPAFSTFFYHTYEFFGDTPQAFPAARFVALTLLFDETPDNFYLMRWTQAEVAEYSEQIMTTLEQKRDQLDVNPYFHNRMLNLANQLSVPGVRKVAFFGDTIQRPIVLEADGELDDASHNFEVALLLASKADPAGNEVIPYLEKLLDKKPSPESLEAIRVRVLTFYPGLSWMFVTVHSPAF